MSKKRIILIGSILIFLGVLMIYFNSVFIPLIHSNPPQPLYFIENNDGILHTITIEFFDEHNHSLLMKEHDLKANDSFQFSRQRYWNVPFPSTSVTWASGTYTLNVTVDNIHSDQIQKRIDEYATFLIDLYSLNPNSNEIIPINIEIITS